MKHWTTQAEQRLAEYLGERVSRERLSGEDAVELKEDLRSHIHEEAEQVDGDAIGLMHLENILGSLDAGYRPQPDLEPKPAGQKSKRFRRFLSWTFGVVLPLGVLVFELIASFCGGVFFDPVPTWWHAGLLALVPGVNAWLLRGAPRGNEKTKGVAAGVALVVALFYGLLFLPIIHLSIIALLFIGMGMLSLTPIFAAFASWRIGRAAMAGSTEPGHYRSGRRLGVLAAVLALVALEGPSLWTRANLTAAMGDGVESTSAISRLRTFHSERVLLKACYEGSRGTTMATDISGWIFKGWTIPLAMIDEVAAPMHDSEKARDVFFRVTGKPFNSLKPPKSARSGSMMGRRANPMEEMEFDDHVGGDAVAVRLKNLDLAESRFDGHVDGVSQIAYGEWTMVFRNRSSVPHEARCQVRLPRDGRVSRLTLWVNGEPREAAFSTVSKVKAAYKTVAVVRSRDPVLVNVVGPDTVMVQCFPVPAHGEMKIRFGVTAPLNDGRWELPHIIERNFGTTDALENAVWLQGDCGFELTGTGKTLAAHRDGDGHSLQAPLDGATVMNSGIALMAGPLPVEPALVWCEDRFAKTEERYLIREPITVKRPASSPVVVVIDGSSSLADSKDWIVKAIAGAPEGELVVLLADDHARHVTSSELGSYRFSGGRNNEPALREGIRLSKETGAPIVWLHGPQAVGLSHSEAIRQLLERGTVPPVIYEVEAETGTNRLAEAIYRTGCLRRGPTLVKPEEDFVRFLNDLRIERTENAWHWKRAASAEELAGSKVWDQLARSWAAGAVEDPSTPMTGSERAELAARYQMVTPYSGAVVLETQAQYDEFGLTPADADATPHVPNVPEPSSCLLVLVSAAAALLRRKRLANNSNGGAAS
jgi:hypothetical protein